MPQRPAHSRPTIYDVADAAGVAISTVSRVLNGSDEVSDATRSRVRSAIRKLNFRPQRTARNLAQGSTTSVAVALPSATSLFFVEMLKGVKDALRERDIDLLLCNLGSGQPYATLQRFLNRGAVDALLLMGMPIEGEVAEQLRAFPAPVVLLGAQAPGLDAYWWDDEDGAYRAVSYLIGKGHRRVGLIASHAWSATSAPRLVGYKRALAEAGLPFDPTLVAAGETTKHAGYSEEAGAEAMAHLLAHDAPPTAVFASSDVQAFGAWSYARDHGLVIPRDLSIVGYDDLKLSRFLDLTTVAQGMHRAGLLATERLLHRIAGATDDRVSVELPLSLIERGSTARPKA
ncbi:LacI family DNA-binding transcriptional regulator [Rubrivirga sp. IMCC45206]|uniref:LacI family DNA-binding transcriptional regulator n=1 Tax=Rubrivirga sp. IMCC45206 TaxID=3391614 RepID=UPI00398FD97D